MNTDRYEAERLQGKLIASGKEDVWGWSGRAGRIRAERRAEFLVSAAELAPGVRCLELGCGTGEFTERLVASGCELVAVDLSEDTAALARERVGDQARVVVGNIETGEGLEGLEFDAIVGVSVLHHVDLDATFAHTFSLLRPGGRFAFSEPNMANPQVWAERNVDAVRRLRHVTPHETAFRADELRGRFEERASSSTCASRSSSCTRATPAWLVPAALSLERGLEATPLRGIAGSLRLAGHRLLGRAAPQDRVLAEPEDAEEERREDALHAERRERQAEEPERRVGNALKFEIAAITTPTTSVTAPSASPCSSRNRRQIDSSIGSASPR